MPLLYPTILKKRITDITAQELKKRGIRGLLLDVDNTLTRHGSQELDPAVEAWIAAMQAEGIGLTVVSNALHKRVQPFAQRIGLRFIAFSCKPLPIGFWRGVRRLGLPKSQCMAVGDQTFTDVLGAKLAGIGVIQLLPIELEKGKPTLALKRALEKKILRRYAKWLKARADGDTIRQDSGKG